LVTAAGMVVLMALVALIFLILPKLPVR
jgi:hypothetical protein